MKVVTDYRLAKTLAGRSEPVLYCNAEPYAQRADGGHEEHVIGRRYRGLFDENDGSYVIVTKASDGILHIDRDSYGSIPIYYSRVRPVVSTDMRFIVEIDRPNFSSPAVAEYISAAYLTGGRTIYEDVHSL